MGGEVKEWQLFVLSGGATSSIFYIQWNLDCRSMTILAYHFSSTQHTNLPLIHCMCAGQLSCCSFSLSVFHCYVFQLVSDSLLLS